MALDVGSKRIGVAVADPTATFALPVGTIERTNLRRDLETVLEYAASYGAGELVVGDPISLAGERGIAAQKMDAFVEQLARVFSGPDSSGGRAPDDGAGNEDADRGRRVAPQAARRRG